MFPLIDRGDDALLLHDLSTARVDLWCEGHSLHGQSQLPLNSLLDASLLLLLPHSDRLQELLAQSVLLKGLPSSYLLRDCLFRMVLLHPVQTGRSGEG